MRHPFVASLVACVSLLSATADAGLMIAAVSASGPGHPAQPSIYQWENTINQSALSVSYTSGVTDFDDWAALSPTHVGNNTTVGGTDSLPPANIDYDLGADYTLGRMAFWNFNYTGGGGVSAMEVLTSLTSDFSSAFSAGTFSPADNARDMQIFDLADSVGRYVRIHVTGSLGGGGFGFGEVAFVTADPAVPEPSSMILASLAGLSALLFCKKRASR